MKKIDIANWYDAAVAIHPLTGIYLKRQYKDLPSFFTAKTQLEAILPFLDSSKNKALELKALLDHFTKEYESEKEADIWKLNDLRDIAAQFEIALKADLGVAQTYLVTPKGGFDVNILTQNPIQMFPQDLTILVPETKHDVEQAAKCIAFEVSTAAGFHLHRMNESVVHRYWDAVTNGKPRPNRSAVGIYIAEMKKEGVGGDTIIATLEQINALHRNPHTHEENLSVKELDIWEAIELFGIISSAISAMLRTIRTYQAQIEAHELIERAFSPSQLSMAQSSQKMPTA